MLFTGYDGASRRDVDPVDRAVDVERRHQSDAEGDAELRHRRRRAADALFRRLAGVERSQEHKGAAGKT